MDFSFNINNFLIFIVPGFITVWTFRYFTKSEKKGDFEFLLLSFFWGLMSLFFTELGYSILYPTDYTIKFSKLIGNPYTAALLLPMTSVLFGILGSYISKQKWFKKFINFVSLD